MGERNEAALKHLFGPAHLKRVADSLSGIHGAFDRRRYLGLMPALEPLEMKPRVRFLRDELRRQLPGDYAKALAILRRSARALKGFDLWPHCEFVQTYGLDHLEISLDALKELTKAFTSEWAVRPFLRRYPKETLAFLEGCARDEDAHLRRWASEGTRPRLPWGERLQEFVRDPGPTQPILERLKFDPEPYVRKSVANHLNDVSKDHPEFVVGVLTRWKGAAGREHEAKVDWIARRALRTLIKGGHAGALALIGVSKGARVEVSEFTMARSRIKLGEALDFAFRIRSLSGRSQRLVVDYVIHFVKANAGTAPKVFKLKVVELPAKGERTFARSHRIKKITTRDYHSGRHVLELQVNGVVLGTRAWVLEV